MPDKPFFMYFSLGATHAPHHVPKEWIEKYKGNFAHEWDAQRERTFARRKEVGVGLGRRVGLYHTARRYTCRREKFADAPNRGKT